MNVMAANIPGFADFTISFCPEPVPYQAANYYSKKCSLIRELFTISYMKRMISEIDRIT